VPVGGSKHGGWQDGPITPHVRVADPALPAVEALFDEARVAEMLAAAAPEGVSGPIDGVRGVSVRYKPGQRAIARYDVDVAGATHLAAIRVERNPKKVGRQEGPGRTIGADGHALITWYPDDETMPVLAYGAALGDVLGLPGSPVLLAYKPAARAVVRVGDAIVKTYSDSAHYDLAARALQSVTAVAADHGIETAALVAVHPDHRATVQAAVDGEPGHRDRDARLLGSVIRRVHGLALRDTVEQPAEWSLAAAARSAALITHLLPPLQPAVEAVMRDIERAAPHDLELVTSHGDFEAGQVMVGERVPGGAAIVDLDMLCRAPAARDLANYAVHVIRGDGRDVGEAAGSLHALLDGYGSVPQTLAWHMATAALSRATSPFRKFMPDWPARVEAMVHAAADLLSGRLAA